MPIFPETWGIYDRGHHRRNRSGNLWVATVGMGVMAVLAVFIAISEFRYFVWGQSATATINRKYYEKHEQETNQNGRRVRQTSYQTVIEYTFTEADGTVRTGRSSGPTSMTEIGDAERMTNSQRSSAQGAAQRSAGKGELGTLTVQYLAGVSDSGRPEHFANAFWLYGVVLVVLIGAGILALDYFDVFGLHKR